MKLTPVLLFSSSVTLLVISAYFFGGKGNDGMVPSTEPLTGLIKTQELDNLTNKKCFSARLAESIKNNDFASFMSIKQELKNSMGPYQAGTNYQEPLLSEQKLDFDRHVARFKYNGTMSPVNSNTYLFKNNYYYGNNFKNSWGSRHLNRSNENYPQSIEPDPSNQIEEDDSFDDEE